MTQRRAIRNSQVRPRPPSTGRPAPAKKRPRPSSPYRVPAHKPIDRGPGLPLLVRGLLVLGIVALGAVVVYSATGQIGKLVAGVGTTIGQALDSVTSTSSPRPSGGAAPDSPSLEQPTDTYTNQSTVDIVGTVPLSAIGSSDFTISLYQKLPGQDPALIRDEVPIPATASFTIPGVKLVKGANVFTAAIVDAAGVASEMSKPITFVVDTSKPKLSILSPKDGATVNGRSVQISGKTQANSTILGRNASNRASTTGGADKNGAFTINVPISAGRNAITITATDPASNATSTILTLTRGSGKLTMTLSANRHDFSAKAGANLRFAATLIDPDGKAIASQSVTFTISIAGLPTYVKQATTNGSGIATVTLSVRPGAAARGRNHTGPVVASAGTRLGHIQKTIVVRTNK
jgi:glucodextranase-like protein